MQQLYSSIIFCMQNIGHLFILCLPVMTFEIALASLMTSIDIQSGSNAAALESLEIISWQVLILIIISLTLSVALSGGCMIAFHSLSSSGSVTPNQALYLGLKKFFPLLWANIVHSIVYGIGLLMLVLPGFYLYARLGLFPLFIMFENKGSMDSLGESWNLSEEAATKLFFLTSIFLSIQLIFGFIGSIVGANSDLWFLMIATLVKYSTLMPLFYLFFSLYQSIKIKA